MFSISDNFWGNVEIRLKGENIEKFFNQAAKKRVIIKNLRYKNKFIYGFVTPKGFKKLPSCRRGTEVGIKIVKKSGLCFSLNRMKRHKGFVVGIAIFFLILKVMSLFVWNIQVSCKDKTDTNKVLSICKEQGISIGAYTKGIEKEKTVQKLLLLCNDLTWCSINNEGCYITVNVVKSANPKEENAPSNIVASADGIIKKIDVSSGETIVAVGDAVKKGDVLVSGVFQNNTGIHKVRSKGIITAQTTRVFTQKEYLRRKKSVTKEIKTRSVITFFFLKIPLYLGSIKENYTYKTSIKSLSFLGKPLPISKNTTTFYIKKTVNINSTPKAVEKLLIDRIEKEIIATGIKNYKEVDLKTAETNNALTVSKTVSAYENIVSEEKIN